jgi:hypothetical protein
MEMARARATRTPYLVNWRKLMRWPARSDRAEDDHVGADPDGGGVAAQVGAEGQRPPQHSPVGAGRELVDEGADDRGCLRLATWVGV